LVQIRINDKQLVSFNKNLRKWAKETADEDLKKAADEITKTYKSQIKGGLDGSGRSMASIKDSTLNMPIRFSSDPAIRKTVRSSKKPLVARGHAVGSLKRSSKKGIHSIEPSTKHGKKVFGFNAEKAKTKRDPLIVSDVQGKIIERHLIRGLSQAIRG